MNIEELKKLRKSEEEKVAKGTALFMVKLDNANKHSEDNKLYPSKHCDPCQDCAERLMGVAGEPCLGCEYAR